MFTAAMKSIEQMLSPPFRMVLLKALGLTLGLFVAIGFGMQAILQAVTISDYPYVDTAIAVLAGLGVILGLVFLIGPVTGLFAGLFLDQVAEEVEKEHYPLDRPGEELSIMDSMGVALKFTGVLILVNLLILMVAWVPGLNILAFLTGNGYLLGREYFEMVGMRHMSRDDARALRRDYAARVFFAGVVLAALAMVPFANLLVPLFATAFMVHVFKSVQRETDPALIEVRRAP